MKKTERERLRDSRNERLAASVPAGSEIPERGGILHTPGPWHYQENSDPYTHIVRDSAERYIGGCSQDSGGNAEANARLIAAAPELLEALKELVLAGAHEGPCDNRDEDGLPFQDSGPCSLHLAASDRRHNQALDVIAKAEGTASTRTSSPNPASRPNSNTKESGEPWKDGEVFDSQAYASANPRIKKGI